MQTSESISQLVKALADAQAEFLPIEKNRTGKVLTDKASFTYDYADLSDVFAAVRPALSKHGLCLSHDAEVVNEPVLAVLVSCRLEHSSGEWKESTPLRIPCDGRMGAAQLIGSADTYGRRYTTCSMLGVVAESDDDGTVASGQEAETSSKTPKPVCPKCGAKAVIESKFDDPGTLFCFPKLKGCGHKWHPESDLPEVTPENGKAAKPANKPMDKDAARAGYEAYNAEKGQPAKEPPVDPYERAVHYIDEATDLAVLGKLVERCIVHESLDAAQKQTLLDKAARKAPTIKEQHDGERAGVLHRIAEGTEQVNV